MDFITLSQLNYLVSERINMAFPDTYWIMAETSDVRENKNGHCYFELIEKNERSNSLVARARAYIWNSAFQLLKPFFEQETGQSFTSGLKVLVKVAVDFHPLYGYGLNILDIDVTYTIGDMQRHRQEILKRLEEEGVLSLNKELEMPAFPQRIAVISSPTAAGYEDFMNHLKNNKQNFIFHPALFPAIMQGDNTEKTIISALNKIYAHQENFDIVVIIRGGGATSDLASFDTYSLATNCAQFPLPIITGIGHERDDTVLDYISHYRAKTPTAVADYLINTTENFYSALMVCQNKIIEETQYMLDEAKESIREIAGYLPVYANTVIEKQYFFKEQLKENIERAVKQYLVNKQQDLKSIESFCKLSSPDYLLERGYSITRKNGKILKSTDPLCEGDVIETILHRGKLISQIQTVKPAQR
ncbi:MAG: exodeoxyribonuclease VII large subunit [Bacteroidales bacterium]|nr:exodeoxyribonuclease VII large subunit [Bacteroidales bacterium]